MALVTKQYLVEQIRALLGGGSPSAGAKFEPRMVAAHLQQAINRKLKTEYFSVTLPGEETIPEGMVLACYDNIPVEQYKGVSRAKLPAEPISLRRNMGVYFVGPAVNLAQLDTLELVATAYSSDTVYLNWEFISLATGYVLERATNSRFTTGVSIIFTGGINDLFFADTGLTPNTIYYYRLTATRSGYKDSDYMEDNVVTPVASLFDSTFDLTF